LRDAWTGFRAPATSGGSKHSAASASSWINDKERVSQLPRLFLSREYSLAQSNIIITKRLNNFHRMEKVEKKRIVKNAQQAQEHEGDQQQQSPALSPLPNLAFRFMIPNWLRRYSQSMAARLLPKTFISRRQAFLFLVCFYVIDCTQRQEGPLRPQPRHQDPFTICHPRFVGAAAHAAGAEPARRGRRSSEERAEEIVRLALDQGHKALSWI
jgi:hypothetical protein